jgi:hypothetical protein
MHKILVHMYMYICVHICLYIFVSVYILIYKLVIFAELISTFEMETGGPVYIEALL